MNKLIIILLIVVLLLWIITPITEFFKYRTKKIIRFENNAFRHFNHLFVAIPFFGFSCWLFFLYDENFPLYLNLFILGLGGLMLILSLLTFYLYFNYLMHFREKYLVYNFNSNALEINGNIIRPDMIKNIIKYQVKPRKLIMIWSNFEYLEINLKNGTRFFISSLLLNLSYLDAFFDGCYIEYNDTTFPVIRNNLP